METVSIALTTQAGSLGTCLRRRVDEQPASGTQRRAKSGRSVRGRRDPKRLPLTDVGFGMLRQPEPAGLPIGTAPVDTGLSVFSHFDGEQVSLASTERRDAQSSWETSNERPHGKRSRQDLGRRCARRPYTRELQASSTITGFVCGAFCRSRTEGWAHRLPDPVTVIGNDLWEETLDSSVRRALMS